MIYDHPVPALLDECEAVSRRQRPGFPVLNVRERVVASVDRGAAVDADQLIAKSDLEARQHFESGDEIIAQRCPIRSHRWRERSPEDSIRRVEKNDLVGVILPQGLAPFRRRGGNVFLRPGRGDGFRLGQSATEQEERRQSREPVSHGPPSSSMKGLQRPDSMLLASTTLRLDTTTTAQPAAAKACCSPGGSYSGAKRSRETR